MQAYAEGFEIMHASRLRARHARRSPTSGTRARSCARGCCELAERAFEQEGNDLDGHQRLRGGLGRGPLDGVRRDRQERAGAGDHAVAARALRLAPGESYAAKVNAALRNQFGGHAVEHAQADGYSRGRQDRGRRARTRWSRGSSACRSTRRRWSSSARRGDLAKRKLLPAIYNLAHEGALPERFNLIGVSRGEMSRRRVPRAGARGDHRVLAPRRPTRRCSTRCSSGSATCPARSTTTTCTSGSARWLDEFDDEAGHRVQPRSSTCRPRRSFFPVIAEAARRARAERARGRRGADHHREAVRHRPRVGARAEPARARASSTSRRSSASTTTWARRPSRTCWSCASRT